MHDSPVWLPPLATLIGCGLVRASHDRYSPLKEVHVQLNKMSRTAGPVQALVGPSTGCSSARFTHSPTDPLLPPPTPPTHPPTHSLTHSLTRSLHSLAHSLANSPTHPLTHLPSHSLTRSLANFRHWFKWVYGRCRRVRRGRQHARWRDGSGLSARWFSR